MTYKHGSYSSLRSGSLRTALPLLALLALGGCSTGSDEGAPMALGEGAANTGTYPNLNIPRQGAAPQLTDEETSGKIAALRSAQHSQGGTAAYESSEQRRRRLELIGAEQDNTLKVIEDN